MDTIVFFQKVMGFEETQEKKTKMNDPGWHGPTKQ